MLAYWARSGDSKASSRMDPTHSAQGTPVSLDYLESKDAGLFKLLSSEIEDLKDMAKRTQVKGLKKGIDKASELIRSIENNKTEMKVMRSQQEGSRTVVVDIKKVITIIKQDISGLVAAANKVVLEAIANTKCAGDNAASAGHTRFILSRKKTNMYCCISRHDSGL